MGFSATVTKQPALARMGAASLAGRGYLRDALGDVGTALTADLRSRSSDHPSIAAGWASDVQDAGATLNLVVTNSNPGTPFLDKGATWPGKMPNIAAIAAWLESKGQDPRAAWIVSKRLQLKGMPAQHWTRDAFAAAQPAITEIPRQVIRRVVAGL